MIFPHFHKSVENPLGYTIKAIQTYKGGEFKALASHVFNIVLSTD